MEQFKASDLPTLSRAYYKEILSRYIGKDLTSYVHKDEQGGQYNYLEYLYDQAVSEEKLGVYGNLDCKISKLKPQLSCELLDTNDSRLEVSLNRAYKQAYQILSQRTDNNYNDRVNDSMFQDINVGKILDKVDDNSPTLSEVYDKWLLENDISIRTQKKDRTFLNLFIVSFGDLKVSEVSLEVANQFKEILLKLPKNRTQLYPNVPIKELITREFPSDERMTPKTVNDYITLMSKILKWAKRHGLIECNFFEGLRVARRNKSGKARDSRNAYCDDDLNILFKSPVYTGRTSISRYCSQGDLIIKDELYWFPLISLYSGLRLEEIAQLRRSNIRRIEGVLCFDVNDNLGQTLKNVNATRIVPIHKMLIQMGFEEYIDTLSKDDSKPMWGGVSLNADGIYGPSIGKKYARLKKSLGFGNDGMRCFHSFRHTFADGLKEAKGMEGEMSLILGHEVKSMVYHTYGSGMSILRKKEIVDAVEYNVDLSHMLFK